MRSVTYQTCCLLCKQKGIDKRYIGESARSAYERGAEHLKGYESESVKNHMHKHHQIDHQGEVSPPEFSMKVVKSHQSPLYRQIHEAIMILKHESATLNSKGEYNRCQLPRLSVMMGEREVVKKKKEGDEEVCEDLDSTDPKRKQHPSMEIRKRKRRKLDSCSGEGRIFAMLTTGTPKRKMMTEDDRKMKCEKKPRRQEDDHQLINSEHKNLPCFNQSVPTSVKNQQIPRAELSPSSTSACLSLDIISNSKKKNLNGAKTIIDFFEKFGKTNATQPNRIAKLKEKFKIHPTLNKPPQVTTTPAPLVDGSRNKAKIHPTLLPPPNYSTKKKPTKIPAQTARNKRQVALGNNYEYRKISEFFKKVKSEDNN